MSAAVLSRWPVEIAFDVGLAEVDSDGKVSAAALTAWFDRGRAAYFELLRRYGLDANLVVTTSHMRQHRPITTPGAVALAVGVTELRERSFDMQLRARQKGDVGIVASGLCTIVWMDSATGKQIDLPAELSNALIGVERNAAFYC